MVSTMDYKQLLEQAKVNQKRLEKFQALELKLLETNSLSSLVKVLVGDYRREFSLDALGLTLFDWHGDLQEFMSDKSNLPPGAAISAAPDALRQLDHCPGGIRLGEYKPDIHDQFFPGYRIRKGSIALLKLVRQERDIGLLALASRNQNRYEQSAGTAFLNRLATIASVCIENALNLERVRQLSYRDPLTRLYNRRFFSEHLNQGMANAQRSGQPISCIYLDVDYFKRINDVHGHAMGDWVLREIARRIRLQLRLGEPLARIGGEEFAIVLTDTQLEEARTVAERIRLAMEDRYFDLPKGGSHKVTVSCGVAEYRPHAHDELEELGDRLLDKADAALLLAKEGGRNQVRCASTGQESLNSNY